MRYRQYGASAAAIADARGVGIVGDIAARLSRMARRAAPFTSDIANHRFNDFGLQVVGDQVVGVSIIDSDAD